MEACVPFQIYIHIPFCVRKCNYCDFLSFPAEKEIQEQYFDSLRQEILSFEDTEGREVVSVFFGGGTPSLPDPALIISHAGMQSGDALAGKFLRRRGRAGSGFRREAGPLQKGGDQPPESGTAVRGQRSSQNPGPDPQL